MVEEGGAIVAAVSVDAATLADEVTLVEDVVISVEAEGEEETHTAEEATEEGEGGDAAVDRWGLFHSRIATLLVLEEWDVMGAGDVQIF